MEIKRKNKVFIGILFLFTLLLNTVLFPADVNAAEPGEKYIIATDVTFAPFEFQDESGEYVGIDVDILTAISEDQGFEFELRPMNFSAGLQALESNQVDGMIAAMSITPEREEAFDFSDPYFDAGPVMAVREDNDEIDGYSDLEGKTVAVKVGTTGAELASELQESYDFEINQFEDSAGMYEDVVSRHSDAVFEDYPVMAYAIQQGLELRFPTEPEEGDSYGFAVNKGENPELTEMFNAGLVNIRENGTYQEITEKYLGDSVESGQQRGFLALVQQNFGNLLSGMGRTLVLTLISFAIALLAGTIIGLFSATPSKALNVIADIYVTILRGIPLIVLAFFMYFTVPQLLGVQITAFTAGVITLSLNTTAYIAEQVRGGIAAVEKGQLEAARSLGLPYGLSMRKVVLPQAIKIMIPSLINQFVITLKDTSILSVIGIVELTQTGRIIIARNYQSGPMWIIVAIMYLVLITLLTKLSNLIERRLVAND
ncbi:amino acid ABC transporter substrate-binding protein/permease [Marinilactibacillus kalidii]|uniref:amino acid ABC transporter substrate-binding protein/permease n=1 Tax=Marinilactibacillus kalidii TaxID=2820274 RepID=UPI001ABE0F04|nr:amino acid ABC transporter substrate-binding protein/permease [Marinilactibacillus kalidii]